jgi:hypothetical protein
MQKTLFLILPLALTLAGCGGTNDSTPPTKPETPAAPKAAEATEKAPPKDDSPAPLLGEWTQQLKEMRFPSAPAAGRLSGLAFAPKAVELSRIGGRSLTLRQGDEFNPDLEVKIALSAGKDDNFSGKTYEIGPDAGAGSLSVGVTRKGAEGGLPERGSYNEKLALRLEFGAEDGGNLPGKIYLCLPDAAKSYVAGTFTAALEPDYTKPPRPDEFACVGGKVVLKGRDDYDVVAGFIGLTADNATVTNLTGTIVTTKADVSVSSAPYPPQRSTLVADAEAGCFYRHARLAPGRYLFFAGVNPRYIDWRWVEVRDKAPLAIDFAVEPDVAGTLEVVLPKDAKGGVVLVPLDEAGKVPDVKEALQAMTFAMKTDVPAKDGKVVLDGLRPGNYRATVGGTGKDVTVKAKETVRVDLSAP